MKLIQIKKRWWWLLGLPLFLFALFLAADKLFPLPIQSLKPTQTILAEDGQPLWRFADEQGIWRYPVTLNELPKHYLQALLTYEDRWFYYHWGINPAAIFRACWQYLINGRIISGGSTLTMQVARIIDPHDKTLLGKLRQVFRAAQLEWHYSKDEILTLYVNRAPFGGTLAGIGAASWAYLGKAPSAITPAESALLAVLPQAPSRLRPDRYPQQAQQARDKVLDRLQAFSVWPESMIDDIRQEEVWVYPRKPPQLAPLLARRLSVRYPDRPIIHTTIDTALQYTLEDLAINWKNKLLPKGSLAILVVDHTDMSVKAYVGSVDFNDKARFGQVDMIAALRSPGSTLKPFLYAFALEDGLIHSESLLQDVPRITSDYRPLNFDTGFSGPVSVSQALQRSLNLPAVQLLEIYGPKRFATKLYQTGLKLHSAGNEPNLSYILGGASTRMDQLLAAYSAFARQGKVAQLRFTLDQPLVEKSLFSHAAGWVVRQILAGESPQSDALVGSSVVPLAFKTGTSYGYRDAWAVGINARYLIGVWVGRPDGTPVAGQYGNASAVPILQQVNTILLNRLRAINQVLPEDPQPDTVTSTMICWPTGEALASSDPNCHRQMRTWIVNDVIPPTLSSFESANHQAMRAGQITVWVNQQGYRVASDCPDAHKKQLAIWPIALENWLRPEERRAELLPKIDKNCPILTDTSFGPLLINGMIDQQVLKPLPQKNSVTITLNSLGGFGQRWWFVDGKLQQSLPEGQRFEFTLSDKGAHNLLLLDESGQIDRLSFRLE
ncbi:peptidoglycan glycosyltransferase PbpC [Utexia brackfieldae]|uniref:peptidoglycan glycosyltransferase PbpC n=1 Tax=Utexia brackfieldae TaxID=3074108 RepID=UPI00370D1659